MKAYKRDLRTLRDNGFEPIGATIYKGKRILLFKEMEDTIETLYYAVSTQSLKEATTFYHIEQFARKLVCKTESIEIEWFDEKYEYIFEDLLLAVEIQRLNPEFSVANIREFSEAKYKNIPREIKLEMDITPAKVIIAAIVLTAIVFICWFV